MRRAATFAVAVAVALLLAVAGLAGPAAAPAAPRSAITPLASLDAVAQDHELFRRVAERGVADASLWWNPKDGWYDDALTGPGNGRLAMLWTAFPLFESLNARAIAEPSPENIAAVHEFARRAERYWNPTLKPDGGYGYSPDAPDDVGFFDDNGWFGIAFLDAHRATGAPRYLQSAARALRYILTAGWAHDSVGGIWWDSRHSHKTAEPLAAAAFIAAALYGRTGDRAYLAEAVRLIRWADKHSWNAARGLYQRSDTSDVVMDYVQGMMIGAHLELCTSTGRHAYCVKARELAEASLVAFPSPLNWGPQYDCIYLRFLLDLYRHDRDPRWYLLVHEHAQRALANAADERGLFVLPWDGGDITEHEAEPDMLAIHAATVSVFAWLAAAPLPSRRELEHAA